MIQSTDNIQLVYHRLFVHLSPGTCSLHGSIICPAVDLQEPDSDIATGKLCTWVRLLYRIKTLD